MPPPRWSQPFQGEWNDTTLYKTGTGEIVVWHGGSWKVAADNSNSEPISGNTNWTLVGGTPYAEVTLTPSTIATFPFYGPNSINITSVNQGTKTFGVNHDPRGLANASTFDIAGSTGNDGTYTIASTTISTVTVVQVVPDAVADGFIFNFSGSALLGLTIIPAPGAGLAAFPIIGGLSVVTTGTAWASEAVPDVYWGLPSDGHSPIISSIHDALAANLASVDRERFTLPTTSFGAIGLPGAVNKAVVIKTGTDVSNSGGTIGTRSITYRLYYLILPVA